MGCFNFDTRTTSIRVPWLKWCCRLAHSIRACLSRCRLGDVDHSWRCHATAEETPTDPFSFAQLSGMQLSKAACSSRHCDTIVIPYYATQVQQKQANIPFQSGSGFYPYNEHMPWAELGILHRHCALPEKSCQPDQHAIQHSLYWHNQWPPCLDSNKILKAELFRETAGWWRFWKVKGRKSIQSTDDTHSDFYHLACTAWRTCSQTCSSPQCAFQEEQVKVASKSIDVYHLLVA